MSAILGLVPRTTDSSPDSGPKGPLLTYSRVQLLQLGRRGVVPSGMGPLESWFGTMQPASGGPRSSHPPGLDDPAIAAIQGPGGRGGRAQAAGSFGDGFGFGGGIGGRGLGRGTRNIG